ncbi:MAG TPA: hypothetical protein PKY05_00175 [Fibrobacteria bacterium]|nr:hypothetical protein [Fibrobacteria bacterium]
MKTLEAYLKENLGRSIGEHALCAHETANGILLYIHPSGKDGDTLDFTAKGNLLLAAQLDDSHLDPGCKSGREEKRKVNQCQEAIESLLEGRSICECRIIIGAISANLQEAMLSQKFYPDQIEPRSWVYRTNTQPSGNAMRAPSNPENEQYQAVAASVNFPQEKSMEISTDQRIRL